MRLKRLRAGCYQTRDGKYEIILDPHSGGEVGGWGFRSWLIFENSDDTGAIYLGGTMHHRTLDDARYALSNHLATQENAP